MADNIDRLDKIDRKILWNLDYDSRISLSELSKQLRLSKQSTHYRINKLERAGVIKGYMSIIDVHKLGYMTYRVYLRYRNVTDVNEKEIISFFCKQSTVWVVSTAGTFDLEVVYVARNFIHFNNMLKEAKEKYGKYFSKYHISMAAVNYLYKRDYLLDKKREQFIPYYYGREPIKTDLDSVDMKILKIICNNCRQSNKAVGDELGISYHTVKDRIIRMEKIGVIQCHRMFMDINKIGRKFFKAQLILNNPTSEDEKQIYSYCSNLNFVAYLVEVVGEWQLEIETEVESQEEFMQFLRNLRNKFPELIADYNILQVTKEHKIDFYPSD
jgi:DNA-binding Lrp family transcriptional regulator